jgi:pyruvate kinase
MVVRDFMKEQGRVVPIISKIEKPEAVDYLENILKVTDGIMIARGDLGVELPPEKVPTIQRRAIRMARARGKQTIVATQMLVSMTKHSRPTHAEVSDVANAVFDGTDAVMLSEETAAGRYPVETVELMSEIARTAEQETRSHLEVDLVPELANSYPGALSRAAVMTAESMNAEAIVSFTHRGLSPRVISDWRPDCPIIGFAPSSGAARRMALFWGVQPFRIEAPNSFEELVEAFEKINSEYKVVPEGSTVVMTSKMPFVEGQLSNMFKLHTVGGENAETQDILAAPSTDDEA